MATDYAAGVAEETEQQSVITVRRALEGLGVSGQIRRLDDSARTAQQAADGLGIDVGQIANSLIFMADGQPVLVLASGGHRVRVGEGLSRGGSPAYTPAMRRFPPIAAALGLPAD